MLLQVLNWPGLRYCDFEQLVILIQNCSNFQFPWSVPVLVSGEKLIAKSVWMRNICESFSWHCRFLQDAEPILTTTFTMLCSGTFWSLKALHQIHTGNCYTFEQTEYQNMISSFCIEYINNKRNISKYVNFQKLFRHTIRNWIGASKGGDSCSEKL